MKASAPQLLGCSAACDAGSNAESTATSSDAMTKFIHKTKGDKSPISITLNPQTSTV